MTRTLISTFIVIASLAPAFAGLSESGAVPPLEEGSVLASKREPFTAPTPSVYDEIVETSFELFQVNHPYECRTMIFRYSRDDGSTAIGRERYCD